MNSVKDLYLTILEHKIQELVDQGMSEESAYEKAGDLAYKALGDTMAYKADRYRKIQKGE